MVFVNHLSPFLFHFMVKGHEIGLRWYGLAYLAGFVFASIAFRKAIKDGFVKNARPQTMDHLMTAVVIGVLLGGRLGYVVQNLGSWVKDPLFPIRIWEGGMAFFGGLFGVIVGLIWVARKEKLSFWSLSDVATLPAMLGLAFGRIANFANAELWGRPTGGRWGVIYPKLDGIPRHPSELYESCSHFLAFAILFALVKTRPEWVKSRPGRLSALFLILYGLLRFLTDFFREEPLIGPLNSGQYASLVILVLGVVIMWFIRPTKPEPLPVTPNESSLHSEETGDALA